MYMEARTEKNEIKELVKLACFQDYGYRLASEREQQRLRISRESERFRM